MRLEVLFLEFGLRVEAFELLVEHHLLSCANQVSHKGVAAEFEVAVNSPLGYLFAQNRLHLAHQHLVVELVTAYSRSNVVSVGSGPQPTHEFDVVDRSPVSCHVEENEFGGVGVEKVLDLS